MNRRQILFGMAALGCAAWLPALRAQPAEKLPRVAILTYGSPANVRARVAAFQKGMGEHGYVEGTHVRYELRSANGQADLLRRLAAEIARQKFDVVLCSATVTTQAMVEATHTIPIVMATVEDPVASGFVRSLARPGTNVTGLTTNVLLHVPRFVELLALAVPRLAQAAALTNPVNAIHASYCSRLEAAARAARVRLTMLDATTEAQIESAFRKAAAARVGGLIVMSDGDFYNARVAIAELATKHRVPAIYPQQGFCDAGGLMSFGQNIDYNFFRAAAFVDKILKGAKPADLPVEQPSNYELVVNRDAARAIDLILPQELLRRADKVIG